jgi:hypothetical protein
LTLTKGYLRLYLCALFVLQLITCAHLLPAARAGHTDFRTFYTTGHMLRSGDPIYDYTAEISAQSALVSPNAYALPFMFRPTPPCSSFRSRWSATTPPTSSSSP